MELPSLALTWLATILVGVTHSSFPGEEMAFCELVYLNSAEIIFCKPNYYHNRILKKKNYSDTPRFLRLVSSFKASISSGITSSPAH